MRLGVIGGTFDPIHNAHLFIAEEARVRFHLDKVIFVPNAVSPFKSDSAVSPPECRLEMTRLAIANNPAFEASRMEIDRPGPSYTADTLCALHETYPDAELFFITGADAAAEIETWYRPDVVLGLATIIAAARPGHDMDELKSRLKPETLARVRVLDSLPVDLSATDLRERVRAGLPIRYLTPDAVVEYIERFRLYR